jgi:Tfp pilus assembly protein FimT
LKTLPSLDERGLTLTELTIVGVLACLVMLGIVGFYINSQAVWMDSSAQAITQREATSVIEEISSRVHGAASVDVDCSGDINHCVLQLYDSGSNPTWAFWWDNADSLLHEGIDPTPANDRGAMESSVAEYFQVTESAGSAPGSRIVDIGLLQLRSAQGSRIQMSTRAALQNATTP